MLVSDVIRKAGRRFGDSNNVIISQTDFFDFIDDAQLKIVREIGTIQTTLSGAANTFPVALPANFIESIRVEYGGTPLTLIRPEDLEALSVDETDYTGIPFHYYFMDEKINLYPAPTSSDTTSTIMTYTKTPTAISSTGASLEIPTMFQEDAVTWVVARCHERNENWTAFDRFVQEFNASIGDRLNKAKLKDDTNQVIRDDYWDTEFS